MSLIALSALGLLLSTYEPPTADRTVVPPKAQLVRVISIRVANNDAQLKLVESDLKEIKLP